jgi:hypothetical protein
MDIDGLKFIILTYRANETRSCMYVSLSPYLCAS